MPLDLQHGYYVALAALTLYVFLKGQSAMKRTISTIIAVAIFSILLVALGLYPSITYAGLMIAADFAALMVITMRPADKLQSVIGLTYVFQIVTWICYIASLEINGRADMFMVWWGLTIPAILQLVLVGGWIGGGWAHRYWHRGNNRAAGAHPGRESLEG